MNKKSNELRSDFFLPQVHDYPFDLQECPLTFGSWVHDVRDIHLVWKDSLHIVNDRAQVMSGEWSVQPLTCAVQPIHFGDQFDAPYDQLRCTLRLTRKPLFYLVNLVSAFIQVPVLHYFSSQICP